MPRFCFVLALITGLLLPALVQAETAVWNVQSERLELSRFVDYRVESSPISFSRLQALPEAEWQQNGSNSVSLGYGSDVYWFRVSVRNARAAEALTFPLLRGLHKQYAVVPRQPARGGVPVPLAGGTWWNDQSIIVFLNLVVLFGGVFSIRFISVTRQNHPYLNRWTMAMVMTAGLLALAGLFVPYEHMILPTILAAFVGCSTMLMLSVVRWIKRDPAARYYTVATLMTSSSRMWCGPIVSSSRCLCWWWISTTSSLSTTPTATWWGTIACGWSPSA